MPPAEPISLSCRLRSSRRWPSASYIPPFAIVMPFDPREEFLEPVGGLGVHWHKPGRGEHFNQSLQVCDRRMPGCVQLYEWDRLLGEDRLQP